MKSVAVLILLLMLGVSPCYAKRQPFVPPQITVQCDKALIEKELISAVMSKGTITEQSPNLIRFIDPAERARRGHTEYVFNIVGDSDNTTVSASAFWKDDSPVTVESEWWGNHTIDHSGPITSKVFYDEAMTLLNRLKQCETMSSGSIREHQ